MILPTGCQLHVGKSPNSEKRWHAWCDCGWNRYVPMGEKGNFTTRATEKEAIAQALWHARRGVREQAKLDIAAKVNGMRPGASVTRPDGSPNVRPSAH